MHTVYIYYRVDRFNRLVTSIRPFAHQANASPTTPPKNNQPKHPTPTHNWWYNPLTTKRFTLRAHFVFSDRCAFGRKAEKKKEKT